jgi:SNF2 family DNA or RNA helicase
LNNFKSNYSSSDKELLDILSRKVKPFILRRTKEQVLRDLPPKVEEYIKLEM